MTPPAFPRYAVAALFLERQHLLRPRQRSLTPARVLRFVEDVGGLQMDSINVVERAHYLTLWSRFGCYSKAALDRLVYRRRVLLEYWAHAACLVPTSHAAAWRRAMVDYHVKHRAWADWLQKNDAVIHEVERSVAERGPLGNSDFKRPAGERGRSSGWWNWRPTTHALDYLWMSGRLLVHSREHFQKRFDLAERVMPRLAAVEPLAPGEFRRWHLRQALHALGAATESDLRGYLTFPRLEARERHATLEALVAAGEVVAVAVEGERGRWFALSEDQAALAAAAQRRPPPRGSTLLSPFDSFLWDRSRVRRLFGYDYHIEVYTPGHARVHGYYSLPILHDGQPIGRLDPKTHREHGRLEVKSVHFEPWFAAGSRPPGVSWGLVDRHAALAGIAGSLRSLADFVGVDRVTVGRVVPGRLGPPLRAALRGA